MVSQRALPPPLRLFKAQTQFFSKSAPVKPVYDKKGTKPGLVLGPGVVAVVSKLILALQISKLSGLSLPGPTREGRENKGGKIRCVCPWCLNLLRTDPGTGALKEHCDRCPKPHETAASEAEA